MNNGIEQLTEILKADGVSIQTLPNHVTRAEKKRGHTEITFATSCVDIGDAIEARNVVGLVVWVPRDAFDKVVKGAAHE